MELSEKNLTKNHQDIIFRCNFLSERLDALSESTVTFIKDNDSMLIKSFNYRVIHTLRKELYHIKKTVHTLPKINKNTYLTLWSFLEDIGFDILFYEKNIVNYIIAKKEGTYEKETLHPIHSFTEKEIEEIIKNAHDLEQI